MAVRKKKFLIGFACLFIWSITSLVVLRNQGQSKDVQKDELSLPLDEKANVQKMDALVNQMQIDSAGNKALIHQLQNKIKLIHHNARKDGEEEETVLLSIKPLEITKKQVVIPVVVFAFNRPTVSRCLDLLLQYRPSAGGSGPKFPIVVSQDGDHEETTSVINKYSDQITHLRHPTVDVKLDAKQKKFLGYYKLSSHYKWALDKVFEVFPDASAVIIVEDDLDVSPDFFSYFSASLPILEGDPSLMCVSAWNDNGKLQNIDKSAVTRLYRTDFFPGLGWMLTRNLWQDELSVKWPAAFWDDWLRAPEQRQGRSCIRPEISRTRTFGKKGVSHGQFYEKHLKFIILNSENVDWLSTPLGYLTKDVYDGTFLQEVYSLPLASSARDYRGHGAAVRVQYSTSAQFKLAAKHLGLMEDFKSGVPRTGYHGVVSCYRQGVRVYIAPDRTVWNGYVTKWA